MADMENLGNEMTEAMGNALAGLVARLVGFRTLLSVIDFVCSFFGGWIDSIMYRDAGERELRAAIGTLWQGAGGFLVLFVATSIYGSLPGVVTQIVLIWAGYLRWADWLAAMARRKREKEEGYTYSYFLGWPRLLPPDRAASYWQQGVLVVLVGLLLFLFSDPAGGVLLIVTGATLLIRLWTMRARRREDVMDSLDSEWQAGYLSQAKVDSGAADLTGQDAQTAQVVSTADFIRSYSSR